MTSMFMVGADWLNYRGSWGGMVGRRGARPCRCRLALPSTRTAADAAASLHSHSIISGSPRLETMSIAGGLVVAGGKHIRVHHVAPVHGGKGAAGDLGEQFSVAIDAGADAELLILAAAKPTPA